MNIKLIKKGDIIIFAVVFAVAALFMLGQSLGKENLTAVISVNGEIFETVNLSEAEEKIIIPNTEPKVKIVAENGAIYFEEAECADKLCISGGRLEKRGDTAVCLPSKTVITIKGSDLDAITY